MKTWAGWQLGNFGGNNYLVAVAVFFHPIADDGFGFASDISLFPCRIHIGGIEEISAVAAIGIKDGVGLALICAPAKDIGA